MVENRRKFKLIVKKGIIFLDVEGQTLELDKFYLSTEQQVRELLKDDTSMMAFYEEFQSLSNQLSSITAMKEEAKPLLKQLYSFIYEYSRLSNTKEYKQVIAKFRNELDRAFDV